MTMEGLEGRVCRIGLPSLSCPRPKLRGRTVLASVGFTFLIVNYLNILMLQSVSK